MDAQEPAVRAAGECSFSEGPWHEMRAQCASLAYRM